MIYNYRYEERICKLLDFESGKIPYIVSIIGANSFYNNCNDIDKSFQANIADFDNALDKKSDTELEKMSEKSKESIDDVQKRIDEAIKKKYFVK